MGVFLFLSFFSPEIVFLYFGQITVDYEHIYVYYTCIFSVCCVCVWVCVNIFIFIY